MRPPAASPARSGSATSCSRTSTTGTGRRAEVPSRVAEAQRVPDEASPHQTVVLYHGNCPDGFGGAWAAWQRLGAAATYLPVNHGDPPPDIPPDVHLVMVDFAYSRPEVLAMKSR